VGRPLGRTVVALAAVSLLTDLSSEMIYPLLPVFLTATLGAGAATVGAIEGAAETTAALLRLASGWWSDRVPRRKPLVVLGYALSSAARPLVALAGSAGQVLAVRLADRVGKGIRSSPRDALLAAAVPAGERGRAFGFHRAADHLGAVAGPLVAFALLRGAGVDVRTVFALAAVPAAFAVAVLVFGVREGPAAQAPAAEAPAGAAAPEGARVDRPFVALLAAVTLFTLGNSADAFLILRAAQLGVPLALVPVLWALLHVVKSAASTPGGALSDRVGRRPLIAAGWLVYAAVYLGFAAAGAAWHAWALFAAYGVVFGLTEGAEKALVADLAPAARRGAAFGWYHAAVGVAALPASLLFGAVWERHGAPAAFRVGAGLAAAALAVLLAGVPGGAPAGTPGAARR
jgi:MFS family permease